MSAIRPANPHDAAACADILNAWIDATPWMPRVHPPEDVHRHYHEDVLPRRDVWVAGCPVTGFLALDPEAQMVTALYCAQTGQGIGKALLNTAKTQAARLSLWTFQANTRAQAFYAREGFTEAHRTEGDNEENLPDILLRWEEAA